MLIEHPGSGRRETAPENHFGFNEMMFPDGKPNWIALFIAVVLAIMSVGSFYILITKLLEQNRILKQYNAIRRATSGARTPSPRAPRSSRRTAPGASSSTMASRRKVSTRR
jgi:biopolymer transport protein ExbB